MFKESKKKKKECNPTMINEYKQVECLLKVSNGLRKIDWILKQKMKLLRQNIPNIISSFIPN